MKKIRLNIYIQLAYVMAERCNIYIISPEENIR